MEPSYQAGKKLPPLFLTGVIAICMAPSILNQFGVDFGTQTDLANFQYYKNISTHKIVDEMHHALKGSFTHTLLEWSAFCVAIFTVILAFVHFHLKGSIVTPVVGIALFLAGSMDAFHTLAATRLIEAVADNKDLIPFTWAICRLFTAFIMIAGMGIALITGMRQHRGGMRFVILISMAFGFIAYSIISYCATSANLPNTMFPDSIITRPYDVAPLILFTISGLTIFPKTYKAMPSYFTHAIVISMIPQVATQFHMALGSTALFDNHFNIAHFLKITAYIVPFAGLVFDYIFTYKAEEKAVEQLKVVQSNLINITQELVASNKDLEAEIGERTKKGKALVESETHMRAILNSAVDAIITTDEKGTIESFNPSAETMFGYLAKEIKGKNAKMLTLFLSKQEDENYLEKYFETDKHNIIGRTTEAMGLKKDGTTFPMTMSISEVTLDNKKQYTTIARDITDIKIVEKMLKDIADELREEKIQTELILSGIGEGVIVTDLDNKTLLTNNLASSLLGLSGDNTFNKAVETMLINCDLKPGQLADLLTGEVQGLTIDVIHPVTRTLSITGSDFVNADNTVAGRVYVLHDITRENEVSKMKTEFISTVSHELKTPLASVRGYVQLIKEGDAGEINETQEEFLGVVLSESDRLTSLINDLLDVEKLESGNITLKKTHLNIAKLAKDVFTTMDRLANEKGITMKITHQDEEVLVMADRKRMHQVLANLISNAIKYTMEGEMGIDFISSNGYVEIIVWDTGIGITPKEQERLFERFYRVDNSMTREVGGTGLGLFITKNIIELHGGSMRVESEKGKGSSFILSLPAGNIDE